MTQVNVGFVQFNGGELSPLLEGRVDTVARGTGCHKLQRFTPTVQGPIKKTPGTIFVNETKNNGKVFFVPFVFDYQNAYVLEFGNQYIRFYYDKEQVESGGSPYEISTPYTLADLTSIDGSLSLSVYQIRDVLYIAHPNYKPKKLIRTSSTSWALSDYAFVGGPFKDLNQTTTTVYASAATGATTLTASTAIFEAGHVGGLFFIEQKDYSAVKPWKVSEAITSGDLRRYNSKTYKALNTATTGNEPPIHEVGSSYDGSTGVNWEYQDAGYGVVEITAFTSSTVVTGTVKEPSSGETARLPASCIGSGNATTRWAHGAWSDVEGYPSTVSSFRERLSWGDKYFVNYSVTADFENHAAKQAGQQLPDSAMRIQALDAVGSDIIWLAQTANGQIAGTIDGELLISEITTTEIFSPSNRKIVPQSTIGSSYIAPVRVDDTILFCDTSKEQVYSIGYRYETNGFRPRDLTRFSEHITQSGITGMAFQKKPVPTVWACLTDGQLISQTFNEADEVNGFVRQSIGGYSDAAQTEPAIVESICSIPNVDGSQYDVWIVVKRYIDGGVKRYVEYFAEDYEAPQQKCTETKGNFLKRKKTSQLDYIYLDSCFTYDESKAITAITKANPAIVTSAAHGFNNGDIVRIDEVIGMTQVNVKLYTVANKTTNTFELSGINSSDYTMYVSGGVVRKQVSTISGLDHLEEQEVGVIVDGGTHPNRTVTGGSITLQNSAFVVHVGFKYDSIIATMSVEAGGSRGTVQGKKKRAIKMELRVDNSLGGQYGSDGENYETILYRRESDQANVAVPLFTGDIEDLTMPSCFDTQGRIWIKHSDGVPFTCIAILPRYAVND